MINEARPRDGDRIEKILVSYIWHDTEITLNHWDISSAIAADANLNRLSAERRRTNTAAHQSGSWYWYYFGHSLSGIGAFVYEYIWSSARAQTAQHINDGHIIVDTSSAHYALASQVSGYYRRIFSFNSSANVGLGNSIFEKQTPLRPRLWLRS